MKNLLILCSFILVLMSCEDKFSKEKLNETITFTNRSSETIKSLKMWGGSRIDSPNSKIWNWEDLSPDKTVDVTFNIKRDVGEPEGSIYYEAVFSNNDTLKGGTYFTNWQLSPFYNISILRDKFEVSR